MINSYTMPLPATTANDVEPAGLTHVESGRSVETLVRVLSAAFRARQRMSVTWLNHFSAPRAIDRAAGELSDFDVIGIDGKLLQIILGGHSRTSADLVVPALLTRLSRARVAIVGGPMDCEGERASAVSAFLQSDSEVVLSCDGYDGLPSPALLCEQLRRVRADVVIVGLGAGLQEQYAAAAKESFAHGGLSLTCGGYLDQLLVDGYYPGWAYPLRLNWLVRLAREPRRLWRRYSVDALQAVGHRARLSRSIWPLPGLWV
jgi:exopolysaccharide biosynthesis WecB/TagA/CpsF family protein